MGRRRAAFEPRGKDQRQQQRRRHPLALGSEHEAKRDDGLPREERRLQGEGPRFGSRPRAQGEGLLREGVLGAPPQAPRVLHRGRQEERRGVREGSEQAHPRNVMVGGVTSHISRAPAREALTQQCHCGPVTAVLVYRLLTHNYLQFFFSFGEKKKKKKKKKKS